MRQQEVSLTEAEVLLGLFAALDSSDSDGPMPTLQRMEEVVSEEAPRETLQARGVPSEYLDELPAEDLVPLARLNPKELTVLINGLTPEEARQLVAGLTVQELQEASQLTVKKKLGRKNKSTVKCALAQHSLDEKQKVLKVLGAVRSIKQLTKGLDKATKNPLEPLINQLETCHKEMMTQIQQPDKALSVALKRLQQTAVALGSKLEDALVAQIQGMDSKQPPEAFRRNIQQLKSNSERLHRVLEDMKALQKRATTKKGRKGVGLSIALLQLLIQQHAWAS